MGVEHPDYLVGPGHDVLDEDMVRISPQPMGQLLLPVERTYGLGATYYEQGKYILLHWDFIETATIYQSLLQLMSLNSATSADITIYCRNERMEWKKYNGISHVPEVGSEVKWSNFFLRDVDMYITDVVEIAIA